MPIPETFKRAEENYVRLKQQLASGQITQDQFRTAVEANTIQDAQGRTWRLGPDSGRWYVNEKGAWLEELPRYGPPEGVTPKPSLSRIPLVLAGCLILFCLVGFLGLAAAGAGLLNVGGFLAQPTRMAAVSPIPSIVFAPSPEPTSIPPTETAIVLPSPTGSPIPPSPTGAPSVTATRAVPPTATPPVITATATPSATMPIGFFVTNLRVDPPSPRSNQSLVFWVTFANNTSGTLGYRWKVYIFKEKQVSHSLGETALAHSTVNRGQSEFRSEGLWKTQVGQCENFMLRVVWVDDAKRNTTFTKPDGKPAEFWFTMCP